MGNTSLFSDSTYEHIEAQIKSFLNEQDSFLSRSTAPSTRAAGDAIQDVLSKQFADLVGKEHCAEYRASFARRSMADFAFSGHDGCHYVVDVKTHRLDTKFSMPNLTSVRRLSKLYDDDAEYFVVLMIAYELSGLQIVVRTVHFVPIEFLAWHCLTIGALGWGQIQIANSNNITINPGYPRRQWMLELCDRLLQFYPKEQDKIEERIRYFEGLRGKWAKHAGPAS